MSTKALFDQYGSGPAKSGAEVMAFQDAMRQAGLSAEEACVVGAWLGGAPAESFESWHVWNYTFRQTASKACDSKLEVAPLVSKLRKLDSELGSLVNAKGTGQAYKQAENEQRNVDEDVAKLKQQASDALSFDLLGIQVTPGKLLAAGLVALGAIALWKVAKAVGP